MPLRVMLVMVVLVVGMVVMLVVLVMVLVVVVMVVVMVVVEIWWLQPAAVSWLVEKRRKLPRRTNTQLHHQ